VRFEKEYVFFNQECNPEQQTRSCNDGTWTGWKGSFTKTSCQKLSPDLCYGAAQESRTMYESATVPFGGECKGETQVRDCKEGFWTQWGGSFQNKECHVDPAKPCTGENGKVIPHGQTEVRFSFESETVPYGSTCNKEQQVRTCNNGTLTDWTGTFTKKRCDVVPPKPCGDVPNGGTKTQIRYEKASVDFGDKCQAEDQVSTCLNGEWSPFTGTFAAESCTVLPEAVCSEGGTAQTRTRYEKSLVSAGSECKAEVQTRTCANGNWGTWSGSYKYENCIVEN
jgi:hypothetical protein